MNDAIESITQELSLTDKMYNTINDKDNANDSTISSSLKVNYEYLKETREFVLSRPVIFDELYKKISASLNINNELVLYYISEMNEIFGQICNQKQLDQIVQHIDVNTKHGCLQMIVTSSVPPTIIIQESPAPGCLHPNDQILCSVITTTNVNGHFIPEEDDAVLSEDSPIESCQPMSNHDSGYDHKDAAVSPVTAHSSLSAIPERRYTPPHFRKFSIPTALNRSPDSVQRTNIAPSFTDYKKGPSLGQGGFGQVYRCIDSLTGREFAIKEVLLSNSTESSIDAPINKESKALENEINIYHGMMRHNRIVQYYGTKRDNQSIYIFMEFMSGGSIKDQLKFYGPLSQNITARYVKQILQGLVFLHQKLIIHRDIKAANILRDIDGNVKLSDFGTSRYLKSISVYNSSVNSHGNLVADTFCGTFFWMAPEVIRSELYSFSADIWSLGATVVEILTGHPPYHNLEPYAALFKIANTKTIEYQYPEPINIKLESIVGAMFTCNPHERPSAETLLKHDFINDVSLD